jgi:type IV fimbrial biogenesis protein FimT
MFSPALPKPLHRRPHLLWCTWRGPAAGLTLVELMVVLAILAVLATSALPSLQSQLERRRLMATSAEVVALLQFARSEAVVRGQPLRITFMNDGQRSCVLVHSARATACRCAALPMCEAPASLERALVIPAARGVVVSSNSASMRHDPASGTTTPAGTVRVSAREMAVHHVVNLGGRVRSCSPNGTVPGQPRC